MKEFIAEPGGRYAYADDVLNLQQMAMSMASLFSECSNFIISGCTVSGVTITAGYVWINGKVRYFEGCASAIYPYYIYEKNNHETVAYANDVDKRGRSCYLAVGGNSVPTVADPLTGLVPQFIRIEADYAPRLADQFFGRYALMVESPFARQTVKKDLTLEGALRVEGVIQGKGAQEISGNNTLLRTKILPDGTADLSLIKGSHSAASIQFGPDYKLKILIYGMEAASFDEYSLTIDEIRTGNVLAGPLLMGANGIENFRDANDNGAVRVNYRGYQGGASYYRNFEVYNGRGTTSTPIFKVTGSPRRVQIDSVLSIESVCGIELKDSLRPGTGAVYTGSMRWRDTNNKLVAEFGYSSSQHSDFVVTSTRGRIVVSAKTHVDIIGELRVNGVSIATTYATQTAMTGALKGKVDVVPGKGLSACDFTSDLRAKLEAITGGDFEQLGDGYVTAAQVKIELSKKANCLLDGLDQSQQQTAAANLGVYTYAEADAKFASVGSLFQDYIAALVTQGKTTDQAQELLREKLAAAGSKELKDNYLRRDSKLSDLVLSKAEDQKQACAALGAAYANDYQPKLGDTGWLQMNNSGSGTDTRGLFVRQIGNIVSIQGYINTAKRDGGNWGGVVASLPNQISAPKYSVRCTAANWNDDHKFNRGCTFTLYGGTRNIQLFESGMYNENVELNFTYFV